MDAALSGSMGKDEKAESEDRPQEVEGRRKRELHRERSTPCPSNAEGSDVLMLNRADILSDKLERKLRNLDQRRRSSVVSGMKELWMEGLPQPQRLFTEQSAERPAGTNEELYNCLSAKTALILPFHWGDNQKSINQWVDRLLKRTIVDKEKGQRFKIWETENVLPLEVSELSAHFRQIVGWKETLRRLGHNEHQPTSSTGSIELTDEFMYPDGKSSTDGMMEHMRGMLSGRSGEIWSGGRGEGHEGKADRNCILIDEGSDVEAEQEEEEVDSIANDLEVWKCQRMKLTKRARTVLFSNPCIWASPGDTVTSPLQARDHKRHHHKGGEGGEETPDEPEVTGESISPIPPPPQPRNEVKEPNRNIPSTPLPDSGEMEATLSSCGRQIGFEVEMSSVELVMYPLGCGLLVFHLNWVPEKLKDVPLTLAELRTWLFLVKFRHKVKKVFLGWTLGMQASQLAHGLDDNKIGRPNTTGRFFSSHLRSLGCLGNSIYGDELLSLCTIGNWLLQLPHEDFYSPIRRISSGACANHHTTVVLDREPDGDDLREYLFHLTRAFGQRNRPPPPTVAERQRLDHVLVHRLNRYIGVSREGTVALSWPTDPSNQRFELHTWPKLFQGVYLILCLHARGEGSVLSELSNLSAAAAEHLHLEILMEGESLEKLQRDRTYLRYLAVLLIKYSLGMSSDDCGGLSEYSHFFSTMRQVLRIPETRQEIREEIHDVLGIVEGGYLEEQRRQIQEEKRAQKKKERQRYKTYRDKDAQRRRIEIILSIIGAIALPLVVVSGIWGMNLDDLPDVSFWPLLGVTSGCSLVLLTILIVWFFFVSPRSFPSLRRYGNYTPFTPRSSLETDRTSHFDAGGPSAGNGTSASERSLATALASFSQKTSRLSSRYHDDLARLESPAPTRSRLVSPGGRVSFEYDHSDGNTT